MIGHLPDLGSDFSRFHRVDDIHELDGPTFFAFAYRIVAYGGVMAALAAEEPAEAPPPGLDERPAPRPVARSGPDRLVVGSAPPGATVVDFTALRFSNPDLFEVVKVGTDAGG